jgi:hypothetical protein
MWWLFQLWQKRRREHSGSCDRCEDYGLVWLDGVGILCWKHYCEEMEKHNAHRSRES